MRNSSFARSTLLLFIGTLLVSLAAAPFTEAPFLLSFIDRLTMLSLLLLAAGAAMWVLQGGMFDGFLRSFKTFYSKTDKVGAYAEEQERALGIAQSGLEKRSSGERSKSSASDFARSRFTVPLLLTGAVLFVLCYIAALFV